MILEVILVEKTTLDKFYGRRKMNSIIKMKLEITKVFKIEISDKILLLFQIIFQLKQVSILKVF